MFLDFRVCFVVVVFIRGLDVLGVVIVVLV